MGKSPGKWIKTVLFGKKSSRSSSTKKGVNEKGTTVGKAPISTETSPVISDPVLVTTHSNGATIPSGAKEEIPNTQMDQQVTEQIAAISNPSENQEKLLQEKAAVKAQAAFRGYLARRAFKALKGIIRLQALIRGHLVRRQAIATLRAMYFITRFQALVRGTIVRKSHTSLLSNSTNLGTMKYSEAWKEYSSASAFVRKLLSYGTKVEILHFQYESIDPNSVFSWLARWTVTKTWKPILQPRKLVSDSKSQARKSNYAMETESGKLKRNNRKSLSNEPSQTGQTRTSRKVSNAESAPESSSPLTELEKVKRNLRKVTSLVPDSSNSEVESERSSLSMREIVVPVPNNLELISNENVPEKARKSSTSTIVVPEIKPKREKDTVVASEIEMKREKEKEGTPPKVNSPNEGQMGEFTELTFPVGEESVEGNREEEEMEMISPKEEEGGHYKTSRKRRSSLSLSTPSNTKIEYSENKEINQTNNTPPSVPSYMAMTASAKTKFKGQNSPRFGADNGSNGSNGSTRRHSLPTGTSNGKLSSHSPRTQRPVQVKGGIKSDKSMHSSRDGTDKPLVEWRR